MRRLLVMTYAFAAVLLAGCGSDSPTAPTQASMAGTWSLSTVNGSPLPFVFQADPKIELLSDVLTVVSDGSFSEILQARYTQGTTVTTQTYNDGGTFSLNGTAATFRFNDGSTGTATVSGTTMTVAESGYSYVYKKQ
jgi:hypothetical protein